MNEREQLVEKIKTVAKTEKVRKAFLETERRNFVPERAKQYAYYDEALPIGKNQTISQPTTIAIMLELLDLKDGQKVLEVGSGSGYVVALIARIVGEKGKVSGSEIIKELAEQSEKNLEKEGIKNAEIFHGDAGETLEEKFDRILVSCACPFIPKKLFEKIKEEGRIVAPVGDEGTQLLEVLIKKNGKPIKRTFEGSLFTFVPMTGNHSFR